MTADAKSNKQAAHSESRSLQHDRDKLVRKTRWLFDDKNCDCWHPTFCIFYKRGKCRSGTTIWSKVIVHRVPHVGTKQTKKEDSNMIAKSKAGGNSLQVLQMKKIHAWRNLQRQMAMRPNKSVHWSAYVVKVA